MKTLTILLLLFIILGCSDQSKNETILEGNLMVRECDFGYIWHKSLDTLKMELKGAELTERDSVAFTWEHVNVETNKTTSSSTWNLVYISKQDFDKYFGTINFKTLKNENVIYHVKFIAKKFEDPEWKVLKVISVEKRTGKTMILDC